MSGFLRKAFGGGDALSARDEIKEAIAYFVVLMIYADGSVEDEEIHAARATMSRCGIFSDNTVDEDFKLLQRMEQKMRQDAEGNANKYAQILKKDEWKLTAAAIMTDIMLADGSIDSDEQHLLTHLASKVGIESTEINSIIATIKAMRRAWR